ncbi:ABC transporter substrate-binding protein [Agromyces sp. Soil535]|uniref:ABC transporter substrate-binding protein n=1 Tax=Agromyces sp. Soil535 TaxID=1736390 RepID=UPI0006FFF1A8|nr:extracellular solute-binding protein [Agromyces sp. Soil535]KRE28938.1 ABC transporter substrate-binding protein [Agromyces sp. Soil535]
MKKQLTLVAVGLSTAVALGLTGCAAGEADAGDGGTDAATATSLADFGDLAALEEAAKAEGQLNVIALPRDWANYGEVLDLFAEKYPEITINEASPDASSAEEIQAAETNAGLDTAPDVFDLGLTVALQNTDTFAPYQVAAWDDIPDELKEPNGLFVGDYGGYMSIGYDSSKFAEPASLDELLGDEYRGAVAINGDPTQAGAAFAAVGLATVQSDGTLDDFQPGIDFFGELNDAGNLLKVDVTTATVASGETPVVFDWDYLNAAHTADNPAWETVILPGVGYAGYYNQAVNKDAPHPAAARLWQEFLYSDEAQNLWLKGGARPVLADAMAEAGTIDEELFAALPASPEETVVPTEEQSTAAGELLGAEWATAVE